MYHHKYDKLFTCGDLAQIGFCKNINSLHVLWNIHIACYVMIQPPSPTPLFDEAALCLSIYHIVIIYL
jgi:hypothetical protein